MPKKYKIVLTENVLKNLSKLERNVSSQITKRLKFLRASENPFIYAKKLKSPAFAPYRFRIGNYRIFFDKTTEGEIIILFIIAIKHRKEAY